MTDIRFDFGDFGDTEARVEPLTAKGRELFATMFGGGAVSITMPKSRAEDFAAFAAQWRGLTVD